MAIPFDYTSEYKRKLRTPEEAARVVKSGDWLDISMGGAFPSLMDEAIAKRKDELRGVKIRGYLIQQPIQMVECDPDREHFIYNSWHMSGYERKLCDRGLCNFNPMVFRNLGAYYDHFLTVNVAITCVTPMNEHGYFNFSVSNASARAVLDKADVVILEVNENLPWVYGGLDECIHIDDVDMIVEGPHGPLPGIKTPAASETEMKIAEYVVQNMVDGSTLQLGIGAIVGVGLGKAFAWALGKLQLNGASLYAIFVLSVGFFIYSVTGLVYGNGFLAIYLAGVIIGNKTMPHKREIFRFSDTVTWLMQMGMFLTLGLLVNPKEMLSVAPVALLIGLFLTFVGRPLAVFISLLPFRDLSFRARVFISWVGLKGATPIIFAIFTVVAGIPGSGQIFNIVFFITMISMLFQGMSIPAVARKLNLALPQEKAPETFGIEIPEEAGKLMDHRLTETDLAAGDTLKEVALPEGTRVVMIKRDGELIVPDGSVKLKVGDKLLMIMGNQFDESE